MKSLNVRVTLLEKGVVWPYAYTRDPDQPTKRQNLVMSVDIRRHILQYEMILKADGQRRPDQTARMRSLIWAFAVLYAPKIRSHTTTHIHM